MKLYQSITVCLALIAGVTADGCFAQTAVNQQGAVTRTNAPQVSEVAVPAVTLAPSVPVGKTREQVMRELEDFQKNGGPALMLDIYRAATNEVSRVNRAFRRSAACRVSSNVSFGPGKGQSREISFPAG